MPEPRKPWKRQTVDPDCQTTDCPEYDPIRDFKQDPSGCYVLIRVNAETRQIELGVCTPDHVIVAAFRGKKSQDVYVTLFEYESRHNHTWFSAKDHIAYIGKELKKAELALQPGYPPYVQE